MKIYLTGLVVLIIAILLNFLAGKVGLDTWYSFLSEFQKVGPVKTIAKTSLPSLIFLFGIYPFCLGVVAFFVVRWLR